jgi:hypothetical protein
MRFFLFHDRGKTIVPLNMQELPDKSQRSGHDHKTLTRSLPERLCERFLGRMKNVRRASSRRKSGPQSPQGRTSGAG